MARRWPLIVLALSGLAYGLALVGIRLHAQALPLETDTARPAHGPVHAVVFYHDEAAQRRERVRRGVERLRAGAVDGLIMVGGYRQARSITGARVMVAEAIALGVEPPRLQHDARSYDTGSNLDSAGDILRRNGSAGVELISDRLHLARISRSLDRLQFGGSVRFVPSGSGESDPAGTFVRLNYELAAYLLQLLPRSWSDWLTIRVREWSVAGT